MSGVNAGRGRRKRWMRQMAKMKHFAWHPKYAEQAKMMNKRGKK